MSFHPSKLISSILLIVSFNVLNAQFLDSVKSKSKKTIETIGGLFNQKNKKKNNDQKAETTDNSLPASVIFKTKTIRFPAHDLKSLEIPVYQDIPIVAFINNYYGALSYEQKKTLDKTLENYRLLLEINVLENVYKTRGSPFTIYQSAKDQPTIYTNQNLRKLLREGLFTEKYIEKYFCLPDAPNKNCGDMWGGASTDKLHGQKAYDDFLKSGIYETIQQTANGLPREMYFLMSYKLPEYNFERKGFPLDLRLTSSGWYSFSSTSGVKPYYRDELFLTMTPDDGQALKRNISQPGLQSNHPDNHLVYVLCRIEFLKDNLALNEKSYGNTALVGKIKEGTIELFEDPLLKRKITDFKMVKSTTMTGKVAVKSETSDQFLSTLPIKLGDEGLADFNIIAYKGLPLLGNTEDVEKKIILPGDQSFNYTCYASLINYWNGLGLTKFRKSPFLKHDPGTPWTEEMAKSQLANNLLINTLSWLVTEELYDQFFCNDKTCSGTTMSGMTVRYRVVKGKAPFGNGIAWGGSADEFEVREAYSRFEKSSVEKSLAAAAEKAPKTAFVLGAVTLSEYDFDKEGFPVTLYHSSENVQIERFRFENIDKREGKTSFLKMSPEKAKEFKNTVLAGLHPNRPMLPVIYKIKFLNETPVKYDDIRSVHYEIVGNEFELFRNKMLDEKITTLTFNK